MIGSPLRMLAALSGAIAHALRPVAASRAEGAGDAPGPGASGRLAIEGTLLLAAGLCATLALLLLASVVGFVDLPATAEDRAKDTALVVASLLHSALGVLLAALMWAVGAGAVRYLLRVDADPADYLLPGLLLGIPIFTIAAVLSLQGRAGAFAALVVLAVALGGLVFRPVPRSHWRSLAGPAALIAPLAILLGAWFGLFRHGPTDTLAAWPHPDTAHYAGMLHSWLHHPWPVPNLGYEGDVYAFLNMAWATWGAVLLRALPLDSFLFVTAAAGGAFGLASGLSLALHLRSRAGWSAASDPLGATLVVLALLIASIYPTWVVDSVPMMFMAGVGIAVWHMTRRGVQDIWWGAAGAILAFLASTLGKVSASGLLAPLPALPLFGFLRSAPRWVVAVSSAALVVFACYAVVMIAIFVPILGIAGDFGPTSYTWHRLGYQGVWAYLARDIGSAVAVVVCFLVTPWPVAVVLALNIALGLLMPVAFFVNGAIAMVVLGLAALDAPPARLRTSIGRLLLLLVLALMVPRGVFGDPAGWASALVWLTLYGSILLIAVQTPAVTPPQESGVRRGLALARGATALSLAAAAAGIAGLISVAAGELRLRSGYWYPTVTTPGLTPDTRDIWRAVREKTPVGALVFTDQVSLKPELNGGWNTYVAHGERQVYFSQYVQVFLAGDRTRVFEERLNLNNDVLSGKRRPQDIATSRAYSHFACVVSKAGPFQPRGRLLHENASYALTTCF